MLQLWLCIAKWICTLSKWPKPMDEGMKSNHVQPQPPRPESNFLVWTSHESLSIIKWPVSRGMAIHFLSFKCFPPLRRTHWALVSVLFVRVCVWVKAFSVIDFVSHQVIMWVVLCMFSARHCTKQKALNPIWLLLFVSGDFKIYLIQLRAMKTSLSVPQTTYVVYLCFFSLPFLHPSFFPPNPRPDFKHMLGNDR